MDMRLLFGSMFRTFVRLVTVWLVYVSERVVELLNNMLQVAPLVDPCNVQAGETIDA